MKAYYDKDKKEYEFKALDVKSMLEEIKIMKNAVIVVVNDEVVSEDYKFKKEDKIKILSVVSGG